MKTYRSRLALLGGLLVLWGGVLWVEFHGDARGGIDPGEDPSAGAGAEGVAGERAASGEEGSLPPVAGPAVIEAQRRAARLPLGPDPFFPEAVPPASRPEVPGSPRRPSGPRSWSSPPPSREGRRRARW